MIHSVSGFVSSSIAVGHNVVKSILFRVGSVLLQVGVVKSFSLLAAKCNAFTAYMMFAEDYIQRALFIISRRFTANAAFVLSLTVLLAGAQLYDALLWGLDAPGFIEKKNRVDASSIADQLLKSPAYIVFSSGKRGDVGFLDEHITEIIGGNLFKTGVNFTLVGEVHSGTPRTVPATRPFEPQTGVGPRLWLDSEGFSVSPDTYVTQASLADNSLYNCPWLATGDDSSAWECAFNNSFALRFLRDETIGRPEIHWDDESDSQYWSQYIKPKREDNPWTSLGAGGDTALLKQMFTVTKGQERHTFIETAIKICTVMDYTAPFPEEQVTDLVMRSRSTDTVEQQSPLMISQKIAAARHKNKSFQIGTNIRTGYSVLQSNYELLNAALEGDPEEVVYSLFRISLVNITLVQSETLPQPVQPFEPCTKYFRNEATGGEVYGTDCYKPITENQINAHFFGQVDTSAVFILSGFLGDGSYNLSATALNQPVFEWVVKNDERLNNLVLSRGFITAINSSLVTVEVSKVQAAMSYLQITLVVVAVGFGLLSWICLRVFGDAHYSSSLLANLYASTGVGRSNKPAYISRMPEIKLDEIDGKVRMRTLTGVFNYEDHTN